MRQNDESTTIKSEEPRNTRPWTKKHDSASPQHMGSYIATQVNIHIHTHSLSVAQRPQVLTLLPIELTDK